MELGIEQWARKLCFEGSNEFLLELDPRCTERDFIDYERAIVQLQGMGMSVIIAHPERYRAIQENIDLAERLVDMGCLLQASSDFMAGGRFGAEKKPAKRMLKRGLYRYIASDAHCPEHYGYLNAPCASTRSAGRMVGSDYCPTAPGVCKDLCRCVTFAILPPLLLIYGARMAQG